MAATHRSALIRLAGPLAVFLVVTGVGTLWWHTGGRDAYGRFFVWFAEGFYGLLGLQDVIVGPRERFMNVVPFVALMLATPGLRLRRRCEGLLLGLACLFCWHLLASFMIGWRFQVLVTFPFALAVVSDVLPFAIWLFLARDVVGVWLEPVERDRPGQ